MTRLLLWTVMLLVIAAVVLVSVLLGRVDDREVVVAGRPPANAWAAQIAPPVTVPPPPSPAVRHRPPPRARTAPLTVMHGLSCGGPLPPCSVLTRESLFADDPLRVWNGNCYYETGYVGDNPCGSTASGVWQFLRSTWAKFKGYLNAADAPLEVQNEKAVLVWDGGRGCAAWSAC